MKLRNIGQAKWWAQGALLSFRSHAVILLYHRVVELPSDAQLLCVSPKHFAEHLEHLGRHCRVMSLRELVRTLSEAKLPKRAVVVTFDDGYADNLRDAKPLLERYNIPATVFVTTGYLGREFWWDELDRLLLQPGTLPESLHLTINGRVYHRDLGEAAHYSEEDFERHRRWNVLQKGNPSPRQDLYRSLCEVLRPLPEGSRRKALDELLTWARGQPVPRRTHVVLSPDEVVRLAQGGLVEVGAHTVTHSVLSTLQAAGQRDEILGSKARLQEILGQPVTSFSYPYGARSDYTTETVAIVREGGFTCACSAFAAVVWQGSDPFRLPRFVVRDWDGDEFGRRLSVWLR